MDVETQEVASLSLPEGTIPGQTIWSRDGGHVITVAREDTWTPCPECTDQHTWLVKINARTGEVELNSRSVAKHVSVPRAVPNSDQFLMFVNDLTVDNVPNTINAPQSLVLSSLVEGGQYKLLVNETSPLAGVGQVYPNRINPWPNRMFLKVCFVWSISCENLFYLCNIYLEQ